MRKVLLLSLALFIVGNVLIAQNKCPVKFGKLVPEDFNVQLPASDSGAAAVVVADVGLTEFVSDHSDVSIVMEFTRHTRIKIFNKNGFDAATVNINLYAPSSGSESIINFKAVTYNLDAGKVVASKVENDAIFTEKSGKNWQVKKFTFPDLKEGSVIEYSYTIRSPYFFELRPWVFQGAYPSLWSEYTVGIPEYYKYVKLSQGYQPFAFEEKSTKSVKFEFRVRESNNNTGTTTGPISSVNTYSLQPTVDEFRWVMKNVPALTMEPFTTTVANHLAKLEFQLSAIVYPQTAPKQFMSDWAKAATDLWEDENFGLSLSRNNNWLDEVIDPLLKGLNSPNEKARKLFYFIRDNFTADDRWNYRLTKPLKDILKDKSGSASDLNLLLLSMYNHLKLPALPILLSKRSRGVTSEMYPLMDRFNHVVVAVELDSQAVFLDASQANNGFGRLPLDCYNGHARMVGKDELSPVYFSADTLVETSLTDISFTSPGKETYQGSIVQNLGYHNSVALRGKLKGTNEEQKKQLLAKDLPEFIELKGLSVEALNQPEEPVSVIMNVAMNLFNGDERIYFNPMFQFGQSKNPFTAAQRLYPVELPYQMNDNLLLTLDLPKNYTVEEMPKSMRLRINEDDGKYEYLISYDKQINQVMFQRSFVLNKADFPNTDYETLRNVFDMVVKKEAELIVFRKVASQ